MGGGAKEGFGRLMEQARMRGSKQCICAGAQTTTAKPPANVATAASTPTRSSSCHWVPVFGE